jgi:hypothetical protein
VEHRPLRWLSHRLHVGYDGTDATNTIFLPRIDALLATSPFADRTFGYKEVIIAESDIATGTASSLQTAAAIVNTFRARGNQTPLSTADQPTLRAALIDQRQRELFLEGHHLGDIIRFDVALTPASGARFPTGGV